MKNASSLVLVRAVVIGIVAGILTPLAAGLLTALGVNRCFDTQAFFYTTPLVQAGIAVALATSAGALLVTNVVRGVASTAIVIAILVIGLVLLSYVLAGPPYHACAPANVVTAAIALPGQPSHWISVPSATGASYVRWTISVISRASSSAGRAW